MENKKLTLRLLMTFVVVGALGLSAFKPKAKSPGFINFETKNDMHSATGTFESWQVKDFSIEGDKIETVKATIEVETSSIKVENAKLNNHLKAEDFLFVEKFPKATITIDGAKSDGEGKYLTTATIDLKGIQKDIDLSFEVVSKSPLKVKGQGVLNRNNHNIGEPDGHYGLIPEVTITFEATLN